MVMNITKYILDISLICILKFSFKNLLRCSENKQRKEKTQTMKKNFILLFIRFNYFGGLTSSSCLKVTELLSLLVVLFK